MKNITKIFAGAAIIASLAACSQRYDFKHYSYASLVEGSYTFNEDAGTVSIPLFARTGEGTPASGTVTFEIVENTAKAGTHFNVSGNTATISNGAGAIVIDIVNLEGVFTSDVNFTINITGASDGLTLGGLYTTRINIKDLDHPLAAMLGNYVSEPTADYWGDVYRIAISVEPVEGSVSEVTVSNICPYAVSNGFPHKLYATVSEDMSEIHIPDWQNIYGGQLFFVAMDEDLYETDELVLNFNGSDKITTTGAWGAYVDGSGWYDLIFADPVVTWTKQ